MYNRSVSIIGLARPVVPNLVMLTVVLVGSSGCDPSGTCVTPGIAEFDVDSCTIDMPKSTCGGEFFEENGAAGIVRCKRGGFQPNKDNPNIFTKRSSAKE